MKKVSTTVKKIVYVIGFLQIQRLLFPSEMILECLSEEKIILSFTKWPFLSKHNFIFSHNSIDSHDAFSKFFVCVKCSGSIEILITTFLEKRCVYTIFYSVIVICTIVESFSLYQDTAVLLKQFLTSTALQTTFFVNSKYKQYFWYSKILYWITREITQCMIWHVHLFFITKTYNIVVI